MSKSKMLDQFNYVTGHKYTGQNRHDLQAHKFKSNEWATFGQWLDKGFQVQKGQHGASIMFLNEDPETKKTVVKYYKVFNFEQVAPVEVEQK